MSGMTREEAIEIIKNLPVYRAELIYGGNSDLAKALKMAIADMEKQIPKKILYREQSYGTPWLCPECESDQIKVEFFSTDGYEPKEKVSYCWKCGQALDWSEENEKKEE